MKRIESVNLDSANTVKNTDETALKRVVHVGLSACLAGREVRYNGGHSQSKFCVETLSKHFQFKLFCPEVAAGFSIPRPTMRLIGNPKKPTLTFSDKPTENLTKQLNDAIVPALANFDHLDGYIVMKNSPSCGLERVKVYQENGHPHTQRRQGLFTEQLQKKYPLLPIEEDGRLNDPRLRENFILRVYAHHNFRHEVLADLSMHHLIQFHSRYKYLLMAHHQGAYRALGKMLADIGDESIEQLAKRYFYQFMQGLAKPASVKNNANALSHILGYLKNSVSGQARQHLAMTIERYRCYKLPLITPLTLLAHYIEQHGSDYIRNQRYFDPYPDSLGLRNRV